MGIKATLTKDGKEFVSIIEVVGKDVVKVIAGVDKYSPDATALAISLFPQFAVEIKAGDAVLVGVADLLSKTVVEIESKASAIPAGLTGAQKAAEALTIVSSSVLAALASKGITAGAGYVQSLINAVVALLEIPSVPATA